MAWDRMQMVIRCSNLADRTLTPRRDITLDLLTEDPFLDLEDADSPEYVGGYKSNPIAHRRRFNLVGPWYTVRASDHDQGKYEYIARSLRAKHLWIESVTYAGSSLRVGESGSIYAGGQALALPREVRVVEFSVESDRDRFRISLSLEDVLPVIGEVIT